MPASPKQALRAVVSEAEGDFIVSISTVSAKGEVELLAEETVESLGLAYSLIENKAAELKLTMKDVDQLYNLSDGLFTKLPKSKLSH